MRTLVRLFVRLFVRYVQWVEWVTLLLVDADCAVAYLYYMSVR